MACWPSLATRTWYPAAASSISSSRAMNGSSSTTNSFSPLPSAPGSTSLTVPLSQLEAPWTRPAPRTHRPSRPAPTQAHAQVIGRDRSAAYRPSSTCPGRSGCSCRCVARCTNTPRCERGTGMQVLETFLDAMGDTPLVRLHTVTRGLEPTILAKLEMLNPGGSVKDRIGIRMIEDAERRGLLGPGGTIVEPTSGNTGHGLAIAAAIRGYRCIFVMPDKMSAEKIALLRAYGAEVVITPTAVARESPESYYSVADRLAREIPGAFQPNQYFNQVNPETHEAITGPEIWEQTEGTIDVFVTGVGTGGTITGVGRHLKRVKPDIVIVGADTEGSVYTGDDPRPYLTEGIGEDFFPDTFDPSVVDRWVRVPDKDAFLMARAVTRQEGILVGGSAGSAVSAALTVARDYDEDATIVVLLPDTGRQYLSKIYSDGWMRQYGFLEGPETISVDRVLAAKAGPLPQLITVSAHDKVRQAVDLLQEHGISQAPVVRDHSTDVAQFVGSIRDRELLERVFRDPDALQADVAEVMAPPIPTVERHASVDDAFAELERAPAVLVSAAGIVIGVLTRSDLLAFPAPHRQPPATCGAVPRGRRRWRAPQGSRRRRARRQPADRGRRFAGPGAALAEHDRDIPPRRRVHRRAARLGGRRRPLAPRRTRAQAPRDPGVLHAGQVEG